jgi:hypothetical protein
MLAVKGEPKMFNQTQLSIPDSPIKWDILHTLIFFGAKIHQKNNRGICPLDLAPELKKLQESCIESLFQTACTPVEESNCQPNQERLLRNAALLNSANKQSKKLHVDS